MEWNYEGSGTELSNEQSRFSVCFSKNKNATRNEGRKGQNPFQRSTAQLCTKFEKNNCTKIEDRIIEKKTLKYVSKKAKARKEKRLQELHFK